MKNIIARCICSIRMLRTSEPLSENIASETINFSEESKEHVSKFSSACLQAFNEKKQQCRRLFCLLGYSAIFAPHGKGNDFDMETLRLKQLKDAYHNLFSITKTEERDCSWWRTALFKELCLEAREENERSVDQSHTVAHFIFTEEARLPFQNF